MSGVALARLTQERKNWRKDHPFGFVAKPDSKSDGEDPFKILLEDVLYSFKDEANYHKLACLLPGKKESDWANGHYPLTLKFSQDYPSKPPGCYFPAGFFHPNVYDTGRVCLSIINEEKGSWKPSISIKQILEGIQALLTEPNLGDPAQYKAYDVYKCQKAKYKEIVRKQARKYQSENVPGN